MKAIVIGTSLSGKTTLLQLLKKDTELPLSEIDEELTTLNGRNYPADEKIKRDLVSQVVNKVLNEKEVIFFTNTDYFTADDLRKAKEHSFKIIQLNLSLGDLKQRNKRRVEEQGYQDMSLWLEGMVKYQTEMKELGLVDHILDGNKPTQIIAQELIALLK